MVADMDQVNCKLRKEPPGSFETSFLVVMMLVFVLLFSTSSRPLQHLHVFFPGLSISPLPQFIISSLFPLSVWQQDHSTPWSNACSMPQSHCPLS